MIFGLFGMLPGWIPGSLMGSPAEAASECAGKSSGKSVRGLPFLSLPVSGRFPLSALPCLPPECPSKPQRAL